MESLEIVGKLPAELIDSRNNEFPMGAVFQSRILANLFVVFVTCQMHAQNRVVVVGAGKLGRRIGDEHLDEFLYVGAAGTHHFAPYASLLSVKPSCCGPKLFCEKLAMPSTRFKK